MITVISEDILNKLYKVRNLWVLKKIKAIKDKSKKNTEWLDGLINKIESMKNKISNTY